MAVISAEKFSQVGLTPTFTAADAAGDQFINTGGTFLFVTNASAAAIDVTIDSIEPCNQGFDHDMTVSVPAGETSQLGPFSYNRFNDSNGHVNVSYSTAVGLSVAVVKV